MKNKSFFRRIILTYSCIVGVLLLLLFSFVMLRTKLEDSKRLREVQMKNFASSMDQWEKEFSNLFNMAQSIRNLPSFDRFGLCLQKDYYICLTNLFNDLSRFNRLVTGESYNMLVHKVNDNTVITNSGTRELKFVLDELGISPGQYDKIVKGAASESLYPENYIISDNMLLYVYVVDYVDTRMIITLYIPMSKMSAYSGLTESDFQLIMDDPKCTDLREVTAPAVKNTEFDPQKVQVRTPAIQKINGTEYALASSSYLNLYYAMPLRTVTLTESLQYLLQTALAFAAICAVSYAVVRVFAVRLYRPIERLMETVMEFSTENESAENESEIEFMVRQVARIRGSNQELAQKLETTNEFSQNRFLKHLLLGKLSAQEIQAVPSQLELDWIDEPLSVVLFEFADMKEMNSQSIEPTPEELAHLLAESIQDDLKCRYVPMDWSAVCFLVRTVDEDFLRNVLSRALNLIDTAFHLPVCVFISPPCYAMAEVPRAFFSANRLRDCRMQLPVKNIYDKNDMEKLPAEQAIYPLSMETDLLEAAVNGEVDEVSRLLDSIFADYVNFDNMDLRDMVIFALTNTVNRTLEYTGVPASTLPSVGKSLFFELRCCDSAQELKECVQKQFLDIIAVVHDSTDRKTRDLREALQKYIADNYRRDISLLDIAEQFSLSPTYMSAVFKNTIGDNFKDYLSRVRFERAVELLKVNPGMKLTNLGEQVGIANVNTLIRTFKKYSGLAPGQYVRKYILRP